MTSSRKRAANRANARHSTGPRSAAGKSRARDNALRHGLAVPISQDLDLNAQASRLAARIAGGNKELLAYATDIAEAQLDLQRVRQFRSELITRTLLEPLTVRRISVRQQFYACKRILRAADRGLKVRPEDVRAMRGQAETIHETRPERHARILKELSEQLGKLDRYERRALSRRKFAIRLFDAAQRSGGQAAATYGQKGQP